MKYIAQFKSFLILIIAIISLKSEAQVRDFNFAWNGVAVEDFEEYGYDRGVQLIAQADDKILHFGAVQASASFGNRGIGIVRYGYDGQLDPTFDGDGLKTLRYNNTNTSYSSAQLQADQKILVAGAFGYNRLVQRLNTDGSLDESFADNGTLLFDDDLSQIYTNWHVIRMISETQFMVIRSFRTTSLSVHEYEFSRYNLDGSLDTSFGDEGILSLVFPTDDDYNLRNYEYQEDGSLIMTGSLAFTDETLDNELLLMKLNPNGEIDLSFGVNGIALYGSVLNADMKVQEDGKIVCGGSVGTNQQGTSGSMGVARFNENGSIDTSFGTEGSTSIGISSYADYCNSVVIQPDNKIVLGGSFFNFGDGSVTDCAVVRLMPDGSRDSEFGENGVFKTGVSSGTDQINDMLLQADNRLVFGGYANGQTFNYITVRIVTDGLASGGDQAVCPGASALLTAYSDEPYIGWAAEAEPNVILSDQLVYTVSNQLEDATYFFYSEADTVAVDVIIKTVPDVTLPNDTTLCIGESLVLDMTIPYAFYYYWSNETFDPTITVTEPGEYSIRFSNQCVTLRDTINVDFIEAPQANLGSDSTICNGQALSLGGQLIENQSYLWQDGSEESTLLAETSGVYWLEVNNDCGSFRDSINVLFETAPILTLSEDLELCEGEEYELAPLEASVDYQWQDGSTDPVFVASNGVFWIEGSNECGTVRDSVTIASIPLPQFNLGNDAVLCQGEPYLLSGSGSSNGYLWQDGSEESFLVAETSGTYWLEESNECGAARDSVNILFDTEPLLTLAEDFELCDGASFELEPTESNVEYLWQDGSNGSTFAADTGGAYWVEGSNACGTVRDSIFITYIPTSSATLDVLACDAYTSPSGLYLWTENGTYQDTLSNALGCDSLLTINLSFSEIDTTVVQDDNLLTAWNADLIYQWFVCGEELVPIEGETAQTFEASEAGSYAVSISDGTCELLSTCTTVVFDNINELGFSAVTLFPNPTNDRATLNNLDEGMSASVFNSQGQLLGTYSEVIEGQLIIDTQNYAAGIYTVQLISAKNSIGKSFRMVKL